MPTVDTAGRASIGVDTPDYTQRAEERKQQLSDAIHAEQRRQLRTPPEHTRVTISEEAHRVRLNTEQQAALARRTAELTRLPKEKAEGVAAYIANS
jgi:phenylpyruvate tautomerase PptA (4-oxalocrotonate tautomerase family)